MSYTRWTGRPKSAKAGDHRHGTSTLTPTELHAKLTATGWTEITLTVDGKETTP